MAVIRKTLLGKYVVVYDCPNCKERLRSTADDIGKPDTCPTCRTNYCVPGAQQFEAILKRQQDEQDEIDRKKQLAAEKAAQEKEAQRAAKELKKAQERSEAEKKARTPGDPSNRYPNNTGDWRGQTAVSPGHPAAPYARPAPSVAQTSQTGTRRCPFCAEEIQPSAKKCKHCGEFLDGRQPAKQGPGGCAQVFVIACGIIAAILFLALL
jgi:hypothetical protein